MKCRWQEIDPDLEPSLGQELAQARLPTSDIIGAGKRYFSCSDDKGSPLAFGGWEEIGKDAVLLRSIVVREKARGRGLGRRVVEHLIETALGAGKRQLYLLTMDAADFFAHLGFESLARDEAPPALKETAQFKNLCPSSAALMRWPLLD